MNEKMVSVADKEFWLEFIEMYRSFSCLWNVYIPEYSNKSLREAGLQQLAEKCREINPNADKDFVRKRIANLRTSFGREFKKIASSKGTGSGTNDVYVPTLCYYNELLFLKDTEATREGNASLNSADEEEGTFIPPETPRTSSSNPQISAKRKKLSLDQQKKHFFEKASEFMGQKDEKKNDDEFDILGKRFAEHFRNMELNQRLFAEKIVSDVLISGRLNQLTFNSTFILYPDVQEVEEPHPSYLIRGNTFVPTVHQSTSSSSSNDEVQYVYFSQKKE